MTRLLDLRRFYSLLAALEAHHRGKRLLRDCTADLGWPRRGVYFFFEAGEERSDSGSGLRVVRVGTHAVSEGARADLWSRLRAHRGTANGGGDHRCSVFRKLVGSALLQRKAELVAPTWGIGNKRSCGNRAQEDAVERAVSLALGQMSLLWLAIDDPPSRLSQRARIERSSITLLSNYRAGAEALDLASPAWLGHACPSARVRQSGLWNDDYVDAVPNPTFIDCMEELVASHVGGICPEEPADLFQLIRGRTRAGDEIRTLAHRKRNVIVDVNDEGVRVQTEGGDVPALVRWEWIREAVLELQRRGSLTQDEVPGKGRYRSAFILALIAVKGEGEVRVVEDGRGRRCEARRSRPPTRGVLPDLKN